MGADEASDVGGLLHGMSCAAGIWLGLGETLRAMVPLGPRTDGNTRRGPGPGRCRVALHGSGARRLPRRSASSAPGIRSSPSASRPSGAALGDAFDPGATLWHSPAEPEPAPNVVAIAARVTALAGCRPGAPRGRGPAAGRGDRPLRGPGPCNVLYERHQGALFAWFHARPAPTGKVPLFERVPPRPRPLPRRPGVREPAPRRGRPRLRRLLPGAAGLPPHPREHPRRVGPGAAPAHERVAVDLHARPSPLPPAPLRPHGRRHNARARAERHGQGARRPRNRDVAVRAFRFQTAMRSPATSAETFYAVESLRPARDARGERAVWPSPPGASSPATSPTARAGTTSCSPFGTVFLDEVGELSPAVQVKLCSACCRRDRSSGRRFADRSPSRERSSPPPIAISPRTGGQSVPAQLVLPALSRRDRHADAPRPSGSGTRRASSGRSAARSRAASRGTRRPTGSPPRPRPGSPGTSGRTTRGPATCASSSSASGTS